MNKDYGTEYQPSSGNLVVALSTILTLIIFGGMVLFFMLSLPSCIDQLAGHSANIVAIATGVK